MSLITRMRKQNAIYWPPTAPDTYGRPGFGPLVELVLAGQNYRVRWEDSAQEFIDANGTTAMSKAVVYVPLLPTAIEARVGGFLWLGDRVFLTSETDPRLNPNASEVRRVDKLPNLKASEFLRTCYL